MTKKIEIIEKNVKDIVPYNNNPRINDEAAERVAESIQSFGWQQPIVIDKDSVIVCGHTRYKAAIKLGIETVPCVVADDLTDEQIKEFRLADNKVGELAEWDIKQLNSELSKLDQEQMKKYGFSFATDDYDKFVAENLGDIMDGVDMSPLYDTLNVDIPLQFKDIVKDRIKKYGNPELSKKLARFLNEN